MDIQYTKAHVADLERQIQHINNQKGILTSKKTELENKLSQLKNQRHKHKVDRGLEETIDNVKIALAKSNDEIIKINSLKREKTTLKQDVEKGLKCGMISIAMPNEAAQTIYDENEANALRLKFMQLRAKYVDFARDPTRIQENHDEFKSKMRCAFKQLTELEKSLKQYRKLKTIIDPVHYEPKIDFFNDDHELSDEKIKEIYKGFPMAASMIIASKREREFQSYKLKITSKTKDNEKGNI